WRAQRGPRSAFASAPIYRGPSILTGHTLVPTVASVTMQAHTAATALHRRPPGTSEGTLRMRRVAIGGAAILLALAVAGQAASAATAKTTYNTSTLAGKVASVRGTAGLQIRMSAFLDEEAEATAPADVLGPDGVTLIEPGGGSVQP